MFLFVQMYNDKHVYLNYSQRGNCHPQILQEMRKHYPKPHFLPKDCEIPSKEYVFMGYDAGATMHVCILIMDVRMVLLKKLL